MSFPPNVDLSQQIINELIAGTVLPVIFVTLRFWSRLVTVPVRSSRFWWDDWLVLIALPFSIAQNASLFYWTKIGLGRHLIYLTLPEIENGLKILYSNFFTWVIGVTLAKISVLCLYMRIFKVSHKFRLAVWITGGLNLAWAVFVVLSAAFQCTPVKKAWDPLVPGHCINFYPWFISIAISSLVVDIVILILPMAPLYRLQMDLTKKIFVTFLFLCGYVIPAFSIGRLVVIFQYGPDLFLDITYSMVPMGRWLIIETPMCIISVCLPAIFTLAKRGVQHGPASLLSTRNYGAISASGYSAGTNNYEAYKAGRTDSTTRIHDEEIANEGFGSSPTEYYPMAAKTNSQATDEVDLKNPSPIRVIRRVEIKDARQTK
ncbi:hypothetical protein B7494_g786 [Chlorociboria aeruginascens]|nr:hypothetical protein B7494_g786 [Chlorociboria aeruginascens]